MILATIAWYHYILGTIFASICLLLMLVILLQRGRGVGLAGAFGGAGGVSALGSKAGDVLTWVTMVLAAVFILLAIGLNYVFVQPKAAPPAVVAPLNPGAGRSQDQPPTGGGPPAEPFDAGDLGAAGGTGWPLPARDGGTAMPALRFGMAPGMAPGAVPGAAAGRC